jgi:peptide/nickel transport system substrate-binding protein
MKLMAEALEMCNQECFRIWLVDTVNYYPLRKDIQVASDLAGGINGSYLWAQTIRSTNKGTTRVKIGMPSIMTEPWNPVAGSNWIYDTMIIRGTRIDPAIPDPYTGLFLPFNVKSVEITAQQGTPMVKSLDWVDLKFVPEIEVPADAYISWDAKEQRFITVKEKEPKGLKARTKSIVRYNDDVLKKHWHDGTVQSLPDFLLSVILTFEISLKDSPIFDEGTVPAYQSFVQFFRGFRIVQEDPLVVEYYSDQPYPDAETLAYWAAIFNYNANPWQMLAIGITAESEKKLAFSADKADKLKIERMSYIAGPSLPILEDVLKKAEANGSIPYEKTLGKWISKEQAKERYAALRKFYEKKKHFWIGNGPYLIDSIHSIEKTVVCKRFEEFKEADPRWLNFSEPRIADVAVTGPAKVTIGSPAEFQVKVTFKGKPYPAKDIDFVKFLIFNSKGDLVMSANADAGTDGEWIAKLPPEKTKELKPGSNRLEVAVSPKVVSMPSFGSLRFVSLGGGR